ncbi:TonB-dependent receptor [Acinetobacter bereziniae]|uniref:TonB-dependent receptor domain-containing protein n=1 Tax=Acinetobacter bereziniae TaxID=106648 RepID=UPI0015804C84|nr:TonB-dependent receptor [Acinetobacter bereziniae]NUF63495.1 TonB-dependent receptor [Acinetobacter bereziniae]NUG07671.1 TonB-dependent receptor [Acinetobacter bereziniae]NUG65512.1 TonB-dependent receptor [Acinetobacter bereziniae]NUG69254.1 TonB-dependent receptor [Acinetobacter bereziniae]NUG81880.1 TonB-dependent receptor [Acinetobacter bereziniae]
MRKFNLRPVSIALLGITTSTVYANNNAEVNSAQQLATIVVSAAGYEQKLKDAPASITVITEKDLKDKRINSIADALVDVEGVDISPQAGKTGGLNIRIRGMDAEYSLVLIDGRRQNSTGDITPNGFGESNNSFIPPISAIERIEVIRGPASTLYGSDAMGGVVNIITKKVSNEWTGSSTIEATLLPNSSNFGNQRAVDSFITGPIIKDLLGVQLRTRTARRAQSDVGYLDQSDNAVILDRGDNPTKSAIDTVGARLTLTPTKQHDLSLEYEKTDQWYDNSKGQLGTLGANGGYDKAKEFNRNRIVLAHTWRNKIGTLDSSISNTQTETIGRLIPSRAQAGSNAINPRLLESKDTIFDTKLATQYFDAHNITLGGQWWDASIKDGLRVNKDVSFKQIGVFAEDTWALTPSLALTTGLRFDNHDTFGSFWTPRTYLVWNANDNWTLKGGYSEGYKAPRLERLTNGIYNVGGQGRTPLFGNPNLKPETSRNLEFGTYFNNQSNFDANITAFYSQVKDKIVTGPTERTCDSKDAIIKADCEKYMASIGTPWLMQSGDTGSRTWSVRRPINAQKADIYGIETGLNWEFVPTWKLGLNYTWTETEIQDKALGNPPLNDTPKHIVNASMKWQADDKIQLWARGEYRSERARYTSSYNNLTATEKGVYDALGDFKAYALMHVGSNFNVNEKLDIGVGLYNVFDKNFIDYQKVGSLYYNQYSNTQEGRRVQLSTTFKF